jgi:hypothetical protein
MRHRFAGLVTLACGPGASQYSGPSWPLFHCCLLLISFMGCSSQPPDLPASNSTHATLLENVE